MWEAELSRASFPCAVAAGKVINCSTCVGALGQTLRQIGEDRDRLHHSYRTVISTPPPRTDSGQTSRDRRTRILSGQRR